MASDSELPEQEEELSAEEEIGSDEEEERGSSAEEGSEDEDEEEGSEEEEGGSDDDESPTARRRPRKKHKAFVIPPPRALPQRTTRGGRMGQVAAEEGDEEFWNQEFFAEEANDERYETESEPEDRFDADFLESEQEGDEDEEAAEAEAEAVAKEPKRKVLKPPGYKKPPLPKPRPRAGEGAGGGAKAAKPRQQRPSIGPEDFSVGRRTVRESTRMKVEEGELERKMAEKYKPRRAPQRSSTYRPLTQSELLAEAAKTEIENTKSLQVLVAIEEETRKKAQVQKKRYAGPMVRWKSRKVGQAEMSTLEVRNMAMPDEMRAQVAPPPAPRLLCAVTGQPARYRDPHTGLPYASLDAYRELQRRREAGLLAVPAAAAPFALQGLGGHAAVAAAACMPVRQSARQAAQLPAAGFLQQQQFVQVQQPLYQPQMLMQQPLQQYGASPARQQQQAVAFASPAAAAGVT